MTAFVALHLGDQRLDKADGEAGFARPQRQGGAKGDFGPRAVAAFVQRHAEQPLGVDVAGRHDRQHPQPRDGFRSAPFLKETAGGVEPVGLFVVGEGIELALAHGA